jgi:hypothetical protein
MTELPELVTPLLVAFTITNNNSSDISRPYSLYFLHITVIFPLLENRYSA